VYLGARKQVGLVSCLVFQWNRILMMRDEIICVLLLVCLNAVPH